MVDTNPDAGITMDPAEEQKTQLGENRQRFLEWARIITAFSRELPVDIAQTPEGEDYCVAGEKLAARLTNSARAIIGETDPVEDSRIK